MRLLYLMDPINRFFPINPLFPIVFPNAQQGTLFEVQSENTKFFSLICDFCVMFSIFFSNTKHVSTEIFFGFFFPKNFF